jgi:hypothetical protein
VVATVRQTALDERVAAAPADDEPPAGRLVAGATVAGQGTLALVAVEQQGGRPELAQSLPERLERGPLGTRDPAGQHDVEPEVAGVAERFGERPERAAGAGEGEVVVVDDEHMLRTGPPGPLQQNGPGQVGSWEAVQEQLEQVVRGLLDE